MHLEATAPDPSNFSNGDWAQGPPASPWPDVPPAVGLRRVLVTKRRWGRARVVEEFELNRPIRYRDEAGKRSITVPTSDGAFTTDLTSVPSWFTWLVPKSGAHLPAALIHDGLVPDRPGAPPTYVSEPDVPPPGGGREVIDRIDADRIFRDAMRDTHVGTIRRWLVWAAVSTTSLVLGARQSWGTRETVWFRFAVGVTFAAILYLGTAATFDLADRPVGWLWNLPWMHGPAWAEIAGGLSGAVLVPLVLAALWGRYYVAGAVAGIALATLLHVTIAVGLVAGGYQLAEAVAARRKVAPYAGVAALLAAAVIFGWAVA